MTTTSMQVDAFVRAEIFPAEPVLCGGGAAAAEVMARFQRAARAAGLWALPLPVRLGGHGLGLAEYAQVAQVEGASDFGPTVFGSDLLLDATMLDQHGTPAVRERFLAPMVAGQAPPSFAMTEPGGAGSDPDTLTTTAVRDGGDWVINGRKWFTSRAATAGFTTVVCRTTGTDHTGLTLIVVPAGTPGLRIVREVPVLGTGGQYELAFDDVRVPVEWTVGAPGEALRVLSGRLALGRTLRCLRWLGQTQRAFDLMLARLVTRRVGGAVLADKQLLHGFVFDSHADLAAARALTMHAVGILDQGGDARVAVGTAKVVTARAFGAVVDRAIQVYGAEGLTDDTPLAMLHRTARAARILDGPDELHITAVARRLLRAHQTGAV